MKSSKTVNIQALSVCLFWSKSNCLGTSFADCTNELQFRICMRERSEYEQILYWIIFRRSCSWPKFHKPFKYVKVLVYSQRFL